MRLKRVAVFAGIAVLAVACTTTGSTAISTVDNDANQTAPTTPDVASPDVPAPAAASSDPTSDTTTPTDSEFTETTTTLAETSAPTTTTSQPVEDIKDLLDDLDDLLSDLDGLLNGLEDESADLNGAMNQNEGDIEG
ncbi:MAG: hypothetical protein BMS9Abin12_1743 [Acidimicrobiia bacterium]|nr:MAG: hypothetical protein BMS9Abin12_1743 [Acidimicrobiia bacterium]